MFSKDKEVDIEVQELLECVEEGKGSWGLFFAKVRFGSNPVKLNLRQINADTNQVRSGAAFTDEQWEAATNALLRMGFGDIKTLEEELAKRKARVADEGEFFDES